MVRGKVYLVNVLSVKGSQFVVDRGVKGEVDDPWTNPGVELGV
jgi:hypothetical protein